MRSANQFSKALLAVITALGLLITTNVVAHMDRIRIQHGGVVQDLQMLRRANGNPSDVAWAINMETGVYRSVYNSGWGDWQEFRPGLVMNGVEAVQDTDASGNSHEYVMFTTQVNGMYFADTPQTGGNPYWGNWNRPNNYPNPNYPASWDTVFVGDAAFYYSNTTPHYYIDNTHKPETQFYAILGSHIQPLAEANRGIYKWNGTNNFTRVDVPSTSPRGFSNFWRDLYKQNVLYSIKTPEYNEAHSISSPGGLWRFSGSYASGTFDSVENIIPNGTLLAITGFNQWKETDNTVYSYALVYWLPSGASGPHYSVFVSTNLAAPHPTFSRSCDVADSLLDSNNAQAWLDQFIAATQHTQPLTSSLPPLPRHLSHR